MILNIWKVFLGSKMKTVFELRKMFAFLKSSKQDQLGSPPPKQNDMLITNTEQKISINSPVSVFIRNEPLSLSSFCSLKLKDKVDGGKSLQTLSRWRTLILFLLWGNLGFTGQRKRPLSIRNCKIHLNLFKYT